MDTGVLHLIKKIAGVRGLMNIMPPKSLGDKGIQHVLKDLGKRKKLTKQPFPGPDEVLDRAAGYLADKGFLKKKSELNLRDLFLPLTSEDPQIRAEAEFRSKNDMVHGGPFLGELRPGKKGEKYREDLKKQARCWNGFEPVPGKKAYSEGSCRPKTQTTKRVNEKVAYILQKLAMGGTIGSSSGKMKGGLSSGMQAAKGPMTGPAVAPTSAIRGGLGGSSKMQMGMGRPTGISRASRGIGGLGKMGEKISLTELTSALDKLASLKKKSQVTKSAAGTITVYYASPERQLVRIPKDTVVSLDQDLAYQMGRFYPETKETWSDKDVSGKWNGGTPQPTFRAGRMPTGRPTLYKAQVNETDLAVISSMVKSVKKLRRSVAAVAVKQNKEK